MDSFPALDGLSEHAPTMIEQLIRWCNVNSGTMNLAGLKQMRQLLMEDFASLHAETETLAMPSIELVDELGNVVETQVGDALRWTKRMDRENTVLLCIHMDTVYGVDHPFQECRWLDEGRLNGPGVADAKGGLLVLLHALLAFEQSPNADRIGWEVLINADEEIGSPGTANTFASIAPRHQFGLLYEPTLPDGTMVDQRKGSGNLTWVVRGRAAHAGREFGLGRNAIVELARVIGEIHALNEQRDEITVNVGNVQGGGAVNVVPDLAIARINARIAHPSDGEWLMEQLQEIEKNANARAALPGHDGFQHELHGGLTSPPKIPDANVERLQQWIGHCGEELGHSIQWTKTGGTCDGNKLFAYGLPNIDTMGVRGGSIHSSDEFVLTESLVERAQLTALLLHRFAAGEFAK